MNIPVRTVRLGVASFFGKPGLFLPLRIVTNHPGLYVRYRSQDLALSPGVRLVGPES